MIQLGFPVNIATHSEANRLLGYPADARLLIINADDFGMCHAVNAAVIRTLGEGIVSSTTVMVPCPWAAHALQFLTDHPETPFGVHLTAISEWGSYHWGPVTPKEKVPSLINNAGTFYSFAQMQQFLNQVQLDQLELEFRTQIEVVLAAGLTPTHLDWHALRIHGRDNIFDLLINLALDYGLALRVMGQPRMKHLQQQGLPTNDYDFLDSYLIDPEQKDAQYAQQLHDLPVGLTEWAVHPGLNNAELQAIEPDGCHTRQADFDFLTSSHAKEIIAKEGIILLDYQPLQNLWKEKEIYRKK